MSRSSTDRLFDWRPDQLRGERAKNENVVVLKRLFKPAQFDAEPALLLEYQADLRDECSKFGHVKKVIIYDVRFFLLPSSRYLEPWVQRVKEVASFLFQTCASSTNVMTRAFRRGVERERTRTHKAMKSNRKRGTFPALS